MADKTPRKSRGSKRSKRRTQRTGIDWKLAQRLYERDRKTFIEIGEELGVDRRTVASHAKREAWVDPTRLARETATERADAIRRAFVERNAEAIVGSLTRKRQATEIMLEVAIRHAERLRDEVVQLQTRQGVILVEEDPALTLQRLASTVQKCTAIDGDLAGLRSDDWRSSAGSADPNSGDDASAVGAALAESAGDEADGSREGAQGPLPD